MYLAVIDLSLKPEDLGGRPRLTFANQARSHESHMESDNMDYVMHIKYSSFHRQHFQVFTIAP